MFEREERRERKKHRREGKEESSGILSLPYGEEGVSGECS